MKLHKLVLIGFVIIFAGSIALPTGSFACWFTGGYTLNAVLCVAKLRRIATIVKIPKLLLSAHSIGTAFSTLCIVKILALGGGLSFPNYIKQRRAKD